MKNISSHAHKTGSFTSKGFFQNLRRASSSFFKWEFLLSPELSIPSPLCIGDNPINERQRGSSRTGLVRRNQQQSWLTPTRFFWASRKLHPSVTQASLERKASFALASRDSVLCDWPEWFNVVVVSLLITENRFNKRGKLSYANLYVGVKNFFNKH